MLCACAFIQGVVPDGCEWLSHDVFIDSVYKEYWLRVGKGDNPVEAAADLGLLADLSGRSIQIPSSMYAHVYARKIAEFSYLRGVMAGISDVVRNVSTSEAESVKESLADLAKREIGVPVQTPGIESIHKEFVDTIQNSRGTVFTYMPALDDALGGLFNKELVVVASRPGFGKTALTTFWARSQADNMKRVGYFSLEMSAVQLWARLACPEAGLEWRRVRAGIISEEEKEILFNVSENLVARYQKYLTIYEGVYTVEMIHGCVVRDRPDIIYVDNLSEIIRPDSFDSDVTWFGAACKYLRDGIAKTHNIPVVLVHHIGRDVDNRQDHRPTLGDLSWSGAIERLTDIVIFLYRDDYYMGRAAGIRVVPLEVKVAKHRQGGDQKTIVMEYDLRSQWFG
jgi:replicative DNA helicase